MFIPAVVAFAASSSRYEKNPGRFLAVLLMGLGSGAFSIYMSPHTDEVYTSSGFYTIKAPKPKSLTTKQEQLDICAKYARLFEKYQDSCLDCRPQLKNLCGINPDEILTNLRGR